MAVAVSSESDHGPAGSGVRDPGSNMEKKIDDVLSTSAITGLFVRGLQPRMVIRHPDEHDRCRRLHVVASWVVASCILFQTEFVLHCWSVRWWSEGRMRLALSPHARGHTLLPWRNSRGILSSLRSHLSMRASGHIPADMDEIRSLQTEELESARLGLEHALKRAADGSDRTHIARLLGGTLLRLGSTFDAEPHLEMALSGEEPGSDAWCEAQFMLGVVYQVRSFTRPPHLLSPFVFRAEAADCPAVLSGRRVRRRRSMSSSQW